MGSRTRLESRATRRETTETLISGGREAGVADRQRFHHVIQLSGGHTPNRTVHDGKSYQTNTLSHETCGPKRKGTISRAGLIGLYQVTVSCAVRRMRGATTTPRRPTANGNAWKQAADSPPLLCPSRAPNRPLSRVPGDLDLRITFKGRNNPKSNPKMLYLMVVLFD